MKTKNSLDKIEFQRKAIINWRLYVNNNHIEILSIYFNYWKLFSNNINNRSKLLTINDFDIYIVNKIFDNIKKIKK